MKGRITSIERIDSHNHIFTVCLDIKQPSAEFDALFNVFCKNKKEIELEIKK